ncbi:unnamed protein product [Urochloa humidicola]
MQHPPRRCPWRASDRPTSKMDDYIINLNDAAEGVGCGGVSKSSMSGSASKVGATRNKQTNLSVYEYNVLCKSVGH